MDSYIFLLLLTSIVWLEPGSCASLPRHDSPSHRNADEAGDTNCILRFDLATNTTAECVDSVGSSVSVELSYRIPGGEWTIISSLTPGQCIASCESGFKTITAGYKLLIYFHKKPTKQDGTHMTIRSQITIPTSIFPTTHTIIPYSL